MPYIVIHAEDINAPLVACVTTYATEAAAGRQCERIASLQKHIAWIVHVDDPRSANVNEPPPGLQPVIDAPFRLISVEGKE